MADPLSTEEIKKALVALPGWSFADGRLTKTYQLADFRAALALIVRIGLEAEVMNHHPELFNVYSTLRVSLSTHDAGDAVTSKDVSLAKAIEKLAG